MFSGLSRSPVSGLVALLASTATANYITDELSFGHRKPPMSPDGHSLQGYDTKAEGHQIQILSDRLILTPPYPGNTKASLWSSQTSSADVWTAELEFRASGQDRGGGSLNIWYASDKHRIGMNNLHSVEQFDGLVLTIDQYGHTGGKLRGFLNDGSKNFRADNNLDSLAFGSCDFAYRNQGRPSRVRMTLHDGLVVFVDDVECFRTSKVTLPSGYYFGITAATNDYPDSYEMNKFIVSTPDPLDYTNSRNAPTHHKEGHNDLKERAKSEKYLEKLDRFPGSPETLPDRDADDIRSQSDQFADLHNRVQGLSHMIINLMTELDQMSHTTKLQHDEVMKAMPQGPPMEMLNRLSSRIENIERTVTQVKQDVEGRDYQQHLSELKSTIERVQKALAGDLPATLAHVVTSSAPRMGFYIGSVVAVQILLALAYVGYKRRQNNMPKKYL